MNSKSSPSYALLAFLGLTACTILMTKWHACLESSDGLSTRPFQKGLTKRYASTERPKINDFSLVIVTRIHIKSASSMPALESVLQYIVSVQAYASKILICIGVDESVSETYSFTDKLKSYVLRENSIDVEVISVQPWGGFTQALNIALLQAVEENFDLVAYQSLEIKIPRTIVSRLVNYFKVDNDTLVVGPVFSGHEFQSPRNIGDRPKVILRGRTCPWNTFAIWSTNKLSLTGFPMSGDGNPTAGVAGGVEEVTAISILQLIRPSFNAYLVNVVSHDVSWDTNFSDPKRQEWHEKKMKSKDERPAGQMSRLGIPHGHVIHTTLSD